MKFIRYALLMCLISGCRSTMLIRDSNESSRGPAAIKNLDDYYRESWGMSPEAPRSCAVRCDEIISWAGLGGERDRAPANTSQPSTVLQLLSIIKDRRPDYLAYHTFAHTSFSLQGATLKHPRAVVYGCDGKTMLTFNGARGQKGFERLEMMCFNDRDKKFEFREMTFPQESSSAENLSDLSPDERRQPVVLSPINGHRTRSCLQCHGTPARAVQDTYNLWPRFYGEFDDNEKRSSSPEYRKFAEERWSRFAGSGRNRFRGRYAVLPPLALKRNEENRPNDAMGIRVHYLNGERIVAELARLGSAFDAKKYKFARALFCTSETAIGNNYISVRTSARAKAMLRENYEHVVEKYKAIESTYGRPEFRRIGEDAFQDKWFRDHFAKWQPERTYVYASSTNASDQFENADLGETLASFERIVAPFGMDIKNWSTILHGGYSHGAGEAGQFGNELQSMLERPFVNTFLASDSEFIDALKAYKGTPPEMNKDNSYPEHERTYRQMCNVLAKRSR